MRFWLMGVALLIAALLHGETFYLSRTGHNNDSVSGAGTGGIPKNTNDGPAFTNNVFWMNWEGTVTNATGLLDSTADYAIYGYEVKSNEKYGSYLRTHGAKDGNAVDSIFRGRSLTLTGKAGYGGAMIYCYSKSPRAIRFENEGLIFEYGGLRLMNDSGSAYDVYGKVTVTATASGQAFVYAYTGRTGQSVVFHDAFTGAADAYFTIANSGPSLTCKLCDISDYAGTISVKGGSTLAVAADSPSSASIILSAGAHLKTVTATEVTTIANLTLADGTILDMVTAKPSTGGVTNGEIKVTGALAMEGKVKLPLAYSSLSADGVTNRFAILTVPLANELEVEKFELEIDRTGFAADAPLFGGLVVETNATTKTLALVCEPMIYLTTGDNDKQTENTNATSAFSAGREASWSDGQLPHSGAHYVVAKANNAAIYLNSLGVGKSSKSDPTVSQTFPGESLTICSNAVFTLYASPTFTVKCLRLLGGSSLRIGQYTDSTTIEGGEIELPGGKVTVGIYSGANLTLASALSGAATIIDHGIGGTSSPEGFLTLTGDNAGFTGKFSLSSKKEPNLNSINQTLHASSTNVLGGARSEGTFDALTLTRMSKFSTYGDITVSSNHNFGIFINGSEYYGRIFVDNGKTFSFASKLTMNGHLRKEGKGLLTLGGELKFGPEGTGTEPIALSNKVDVVVGGLGVFGAESVDGLEIAFSNDTSLVFMPDFGNAELTRDGIRNVKTDTPFVLAPGMTKLPLVFSFPSGDLPQGSVRQGVLTVSANAATAVRAMLPATPAVPWPHCRVAWVESTNDETGEVTFALDLKIPGLSILLR